MDAKITNLQEDNLSLDVEIIFDDLIATEPSLDSCSCCCVSCCCTAASSAAEPIVD